jgi:AcrR family transcriptional regulator
MTLSVSPSPRKLSPERRARILDAARGLILAVGLRAATMEAIAKAAQIAKPTLYGYFPDKEAVFGALLAELSGEIGQAFDAGLASTEAPEARIAAAIVGKYKTINRLLQGSPHAGELYDEHQRSGAAFAGLETHVEAEVTRVLADAGVQRARPLAQMVLAAAYGVCRKATTVAEIGPAVRVLVERLVGPELPGR